MNKRNSRVAIAGSGVLALALVGACAQADSIRYTDLDALDTKAADAAAIALTVVAGEVIEAELEMEDDRAIWEVEIVDAANQVVSVEIDGQTGEILETELSDDDAPAIGDIVGFNQAIDIVRAVESGALIEMELEEENGELIWEIEALAENGEETEFRIHGVTGEIL